MKKIIVCIIALLVIVPSVTAQNNEVVETEKDTLSSKDKEIIKSEKTCSYYFFGRYYYDLEKKVIRISQIKIYVLVQINLMI